VNPVATAIFAGYLPASVIPEAPEKVRIDHSYLRRQISGGRFLGCSPGIVVLVPRLPLKVPTCFKGGKAWP